jgi:DNA polymerase I-like protein with 3'-5' exonuclease and polymerase domains
MYLVVDLETTCKERYKRKGNPFYNNILCYGFKYQNKEAFGKPSDNVPEGWLNGVTDLIGHNIKYDLLYLWRNRELQEAFKRGLNIWDTQLAEYILSGQQHKYPALRDIAVNKYGCKERVKHIEQGFKNGLLDTSEIPMPLLLEDVTNDVIDTEVIALEQLRKSKENGMYNLIKSQMNSLLATTEMEYNGMFINKSILKNRETEIKNQLEILYSELNQITGKYWND